MSGGVEVTVWRRTPAGEPGRTPLAHGVSVDDAGAHEFIAQQMRLLTVDTTVLARQIAKARSSRVMLEVLETGDTKDKIQVLRGIQVLGDVVEHKGEVVTRHVVELHEGPPPGKGSE